MVDPLETFSSLQLETSKLLLLVHSGSRALGQNIYSRTKDRILKSDTSAFQQYLTLHDHALLWARANRDLIAGRFLSKLTGEEVRREELDKVLDIWHNAVTKVEGTENEWLHRKGAAPSREGQVVVIPGSRGALSYLVMPIGDQSSNGA
jgi:release factor H-coupled RctB family protein